MANLIPDDIDFSAYEQETDAEHKVRPAISYQQTVVDYFHSQAGDYSKKMPWAKTHGKLGLRPGEVTLWGGMNGHGKSLVLGQVGIGLIRQGERLVIASMEMKPHITLARMCRQEYGRVPSIEAISQFHKWTDKYLWLYDQLGAVRTQKMLAVMRYCADEIKADHFVIDSLMKCGMGEDDYNAQKHFIDQLCAIARDSGMHVHLVAHSRKAKDEFSPPGKMDVKGTGSITDQVDNVITVWRNKKKEANRGAYSSEADCLLICDKQRNGEWEGTLGLYYEPDFMRFDEDQSF